MKKTAFGLFVLLFAACLSLSGCSKGGSGDSKRKVNLTMYSWRTEDQKGYEKIIAEFEKKHPNIHVVFKPFKSTDYNTILSNALVSGSGPDIIQLRSYNKDIPDNGYLVPLDDLPGMDHISDFYKDAAKGSDGKVYGVPLALDNTVIFYNTQIFKKLGLAEPETWEEFIEACKTLKKNGFIPIAQAGRDAYLLSLAHSVLGVTAYGGNDFVDKVIKGDTNFSDEGFADSVKRMKDLAGYFPKDFLGINDDDAQSLFYSGKAAMYINGSYRLSEFHDQAPDLPIGVIPALALKEGGEAPVTTWVDSSYALVKKSKHVKEAKTFLAFMASKKFGDAFTNQFDWASAIDGVRPDKPLVKKIAAATAKAKTPYLMLVHFSKGSPSTKTTFENALQGMYAGKLSIKQVLEETQKAADKASKAKE